VHPRKPTRHIRALKTSLVSEMHLISCNVTVQKRQEYSRSCNFAPPYVFVALLPTSAHLQSLHSWQPAGRSFKGVSGHDWPKGPGQFSVYASVVWRRRCFHALACSLCVLGTSSSLSLDKQRDSTSNWNMAASLQIPVSSLLGYEYSYSESYWQRR
jgi:hypothetical protein